MADRSTVVGRELRTPVAAGLAGIAFAVIVSVVVFLLRSAAPAPGTSASWVANPSQRRTLSLALELIPFAGIAFLWFIGVIRSRLGDREDKLFATAFLGSGLLFVAMLFAAAAVMGGLLSLVGGERPVSNDTIEMATAVTRVLIGTLAVRMAAVFTLVVTNLGRRTRIVPGWLVLVGLVVGVAMLVAPPRTIWVTMLFPVWVLVLSVHILVVSLQARGRADDASWIPTS
jgi:hypothetical protein